MNSITLDEYLNSFVQTTDYPSLDGTKYLLNKLGNPDKKIKFIHIAGTNGKGSIAEMLNQTLINSNYKTGKFISPHLICANESICINNIQIDNKDIPYYINLFDDIQNDFKKEYNRTFTRFEIITALAIDYFYKNNVDIAILEVGLGGLYDCTNVITPILSCFGSISFDHTQILGNTLEEITIQKGGIIKNNSNSIIFNQEATKYIQNICKEKNNNLIIINEDDISNYHFDNMYQYFTYKRLEYKLNLKGKKQIENASVVLNAFDILNKNDFNITYDTIYNSLSNITHPGRFETIQNTPLVIFDGAHNENAIYNLISSINSLYKDNNKTFIISIIKTKDYKQILNLLYSKFPNSTFILTSGNNESKFFSNKILYDYMISLSSNIYIKKDELYNLKNIINKDNINFIIGSFYVYNTVINLLKDYNK